MRVPPQLPEAQRRMSTASARLSRLHMRLTMTVMTMVAMGLPPPGSERGSSIAPARLYRLYTRLTMTTTLRTMAANRAPTRRLAPPAMRRRRRRRVERTGNGNANLGTNTAKSTVRYSRRRLITREEEEGTSARFSGRRANTTLTATVTGGSMDEAVAQAQATRIVAAAVEAEAIAAGAIAAEAVVAEGGAAAVNAAEVAVVNAAVEVAAGVEAAEAEEETAKIEAVAERER